MTTNPVTAIQVPANTPGEVTCQEVEGKQAYTVYQFQSICGALICSSVRESESRDEGRTKVGGRGETRMVMGVCTEILQLPPIDMPPPIDMAEDVVAEAAALVAVMAMDIVEESMPLMVLMIEAWFG